MKKRFCVLIIFALLILQLSASGVLTYPRRVNLLKTQHFDILYPDESSALAAYVSEKGEDFFALAQYQLETENSFRMPVVISPDSDTLSVTYSFYPYNRIHIFDGVPNNSQLGYEDTLGSMLYREIYIAVAQTKMSPLNKLIHDTVGGEKYLPTALFNLPTSFIDGYGYLVQSEYDYKKINDGYFLQVLSEAKLEGVFPTWFQIFAKLDTYPENLISDAAGTAFVAFLIQSRGIEKYAEFWNECGKLHPFFAAGIFYKVYGTQITNLWKEFQESIPLPETLEELNAIEQDVKRLFEYSDSVYNQLVYSDYGIIWYNNLRREVEIYDLNEKNILQMIYDQPMTLFSADRIERLSLSPDGTYLLVSFRQNRHNDNIEKNITWIYDLEEKSFLDVSFQLRDGALICLDDGKTAIAGINTETKNAKLQVYSTRLFGSKENKLIYEKEFPRDIVPLSPAYAGNGKILYILREQQKVYLVLLDIITETEKYYSITDENGIPLNIKNLVYQNSGKQNNKELYSFQYSKAEENSLSRTGTFTFEGTEPNSVQLQSVDVLGGTNFPVFLNNDVIFAARKVYHDELEIISEQKLKFQPGEVKVENLSWLENRAGIFDDYVDYDFSEFEIKKYSPFTYWHRFSVDPLFPIKDISFEEGTESFFGLGASVKLVPDPLMNNKLAISAAWSFLNLDFVWLLNAPKDEEKIINQTNQVIQKDKTFAFFYENTSTPLDIKLGSIFRCSLEGQYEFESFTGIGWTIPLKYTFDELHFDVYGTYIASTDYYDVNLADVYTPKTNFPYFSDAYELINFTINGSFNNIHKYGRSYFQNKGFMVGANLYSVWDVYKYRNKEDSEPYVSQVFLGLKGAMAFPQILPLKPNKSGWLFSLPTTISVDMASKAGVFLNSNVETLLIGKEVQNGIYFMNFYCNRLGLKAGYNFSLRYDTTNINLPDFRRFDYMWDIFSHSTPTHGIYLLFNLDALIPIGPLSQQVIRTEFKTTYFPDTNGFTFNLDFKVNF